MCVSNCTQTACVEKAVAAAAVPSVEELGMLLRGLQGMAQPMADGQSWMTVTEPEGFNFDFIDEEEANLDGMPALDGDDVDADADAESGKAYKIADEYLATRPCSHNNWDNVRAKKKQIFLRCRECDRQWRVPACMVKRCMAFLIHGKCTLGTECPRLHLHLRKQSLEERLAAHGAPVLAKAQRTSPAGSAPSSTAPSSEIAEVPLPVAECDTPSSASSTHPTSVGTPSTAGSVSAEPVRTRKPRKHNRRSKKAAAAAAAAAAGNPMAAPMDPLTTTLAAMNLAYMNNMGMNPAMGGLPAMMPMFGVPSMPVFPMQA